MSPMQLPEGSNQLRQMQLRELAMLNGTLREDGIVSTFIHFLQKYLYVIFLRVPLMSSIFVDPNILQLPPCTNCGATDHRSWQCQDKPNVTNNIVCTKYVNVGS